MVLRAYGLWGLRPSRNLLQEWDVIRLFTFAGISLMPVLLTGYLILAWLVDCHDPSMRNIAGGSLGSNLSSHCDGKQRGVVTVNGVFRWLSNHHHSYLYFDTVSPQIP
jgi:hypothetical protein